MTTAITSQQQQRQPTPTPTPLLTTRTLATAIAVLAITLALFTTLRTSLSTILPKTALRAMSTTSALSTTTNNMKITKRPWNARGHADMDWLYTYHTFSFASYYSPTHQSFGPLRVINEDRVAPSTGFGTHGHAEFLIWSYIVRGVLEHKDSLGNLENLRRGEVQFTSAGTGIHHSEYNRNKEQECHFLQIWAKPNKKGLRPHYETRMFTDEMKQDRLVRIMEMTDRMRKGEECREEEKPIHLDADVSMDASILSPGKSVTHEVVAEGQRKIYLLVVMGGRAQPKDGGAKIRVGDVVLGEGDGAYVEGVKGPGRIEVESVGDGAAEFLLFDMGMEA